MEILSGIKQIRKCKVIHIFARLNVMGTGLLCRCLLIFLALLPGWLSALPLVQTPYDELAPVITPDGSALYVSLANHPLNMGGKADPGDIWICYRTASGWSEPIHAGPRLNNQGFNGVAGFSADGSRIYLLSHYAPNGGLPKSQGIAFAEKSGQEWGNPLNMVIPDFLNRSQVLSGSVNEAGTVFVYAAEGYFTRGAEDIYLTTRPAPDAPWGPAVNLGSVINTKGQEYSPWLEPEGTTLYFSSNGHPGKGSFDVFKSSNLNRDFLSWSIPVPAVESLNSEAREVFFRMITDAQALYSTTRNSDGYGDIRFHSFEANTRSDSNFVARGIVKGNNKVVKATVFVGTATGVLELLSDSSGFIFPFQSGIGNIRIESPGYLMFEAKVEIKPGLNEFNLTPITVGAKVNLPNVLFEQGKSSLIKESFVELDAVVRFLKLNPTVKIELAGHTDNRGLEKSNLELSRNRVKIVRDYLVAKGISKSRIKGKGYGGSMPIALGDTEESRQLNRRVEFEIKSN